MLVPIILTLCEKETGAMSVNVSIKVSMIRHDLLAQKWNKF